MCDNSLLLAGMVRSGSRFEDPIPDADMEEEDYSYSSPPADVLPDADMEVEGEGEQCMQANLGTGTEAAMLLQEGQQAQMSQASGCFLNVTSRPAADKRKAQDLADRAEESKDFKRWRAMTLPAQQQQSRSPHPSTQRSSGEHGAQTQRKQKWRRPAESANANSKRLPMFSSAADIARLAQQAAAGTQATPVSRESVAAVSSAVNPVAACMLAHNNGDSNAAATATAGMTGFGITTAAAMQTAGPVQGPPTIAVPIKASFAGTSSDQSYSQGMALGQALHIEAAHIQTPVIQPLNSILRTARHGNAWTGTAFGVPSTYKLSL